MSESIQVKTMKYRLEQLHSSGKSWIAVVTRYSRADLDAVVKFPGRTYRVVTIETVETIEEAFQVEVTG